MKNENEVIDRAIQILEKRMQYKVKGTGEAITSPEDVKNYLWIKLSGFESETFCCMFLDTRHRLIEFKQMFNGTINAATVFPREIVKAGLRLNAAAVVLAHNHPSGEPQPSRSDEALTQRLKSALGLVDIKVLDHIVVGDTETVSFAERGLI